MYPTPNELSSYSPAWPCAHFRLAGGVNALAGVLFFVKLSKKVTGVTEQNAVENKVVYHYIPYYVLLCHVVTMFLCVSTIIK